MQVSFSRRKVPRPAWLVKKLRPRVEALEDRQMLSAGDLDPSFGNGGVVTSQLLAQTSEWASWTNVGGVVDSSGRVVVTGKIGHDVGVARYNTDGSPDTTFGNGGIVDTSLGTFNPNYGTYDADGHVVAIDPSTGKILVLASTVVPYHTKNPIIPANNSSFLLLRYDTNGTLDTTFGTAVKGGGHTGYVTYAGGYFTDNPMSLHVDSQGRIVIFGVDGSDGQGHSLVLRYTSSGSLDTTFGTNGVVSFGSYIQLSDMVLQPDDKIVVATRSQTTTPSNSIDFAVYRFTTAGKPDTTFGTNGVVTTDFGQTPPMAETPFRVLLESNGDILAIGRAYIKTANGNVAYVGLAEYTSTGALDPTFGTGGIAYGPQIDGSPIIYGATLDEAGRAVVITSDSIMRFTTTGAVDTSFEPSDNGVAPALAATSQGEVMLSPADQLYEVVGMGSNIGIARFLGDSAPSPATSAPLNSSSASVPALTSTASPAATDAVFASYAYPEDDHAIKA